MGRPAAGRRERQEDDGPHRRAGRRVARRLLDRRGAGAASDGCGEAIGKDGKPVDFGGHVFAISSVSGGSVGAVGYAAMLKTAPPNVRTPATEADAETFTSDLLGFAGRDVLGPALTGTLFSDLLYRFLPLPLLPDRAETLERAWEEAWDVSERAPACAQDSRNRSARRSSRSRPRTASRGGRSSSCRAQARAAGGGC